ncbi:fibronectin type III domain-containing protein [Paenibacillus sp. NPDC056579]|uniref:fibronectin type III domain-containing protein n=1 Tax=Paenibacillus sp. NPDC056579 TaxID=3345871 RepID=UPI0036B8DF2E
MADEDSSLVNFVVYYEDWTGDESVTVVVPPANVTNLTATAIQASSITLAWTASTSEQVSGYVIYNGPIYAGQTSGTTFTLSGLSPVTSYSFTVKTSTSDGSLSSGAVVNATTLPLRYALSMNGLNDYITTPSISFDTVVMDISVSPNKNVYSAYLDASKSIAQSTVVRDSSGRDLLQAAWKSIFVDGVDKTSLQGTTAIVPSNQRTTVKSVLKAPGKSIIYIFANQLGSIPMKGVLYGVQILQGSQVVASYDFTVPFAGSTVLDKSGNNNNGKLQGGTWINW